MTLTTKLLLLMLFAISSAHELEWWKTTTFYQVYPRSFKNSDYDGIGDIKGITEKLDHFVETGIGGVWLSPIYKSPMKDFGYDISNFTDIDPIFGTMEDFDALVIACKEKGLKLVMDMVPNHSSNEHEWFIKSIAREDPYTNYYVWLNATGTNDIGVPIPPNNWLSVFGGPAWTWNEARQQFYYHQFHEAQPDLNFRHESVLEEIKNVMNFWLDKGVDGFRMDAVPHLMEDQSYADEPQSNDPNYSGDQWGTLEHIYTKDLPELYDIIIALRANMDAKQEELGRPLVMMAEAYTDINHTMMYYGNDTNPGAHFPFNFQLISYLNNDTRAEELDDIIKSWMDNMPEGEWPNWVIGNHDQARVATRFGRDFSIAAVIMCLLLPGTAITYNGEEINMENTWISYADTQDPAGCQAGPEEYERFSRDPERTPFQWSGEDFAGFQPANSTDPWLPVNDNYEVLNLEIQKDVKNSMYNVYKKLIQARKTHAATHGILVTKVINNDVFAFVREVENIQTDESILVVVNTGYTTQTVDVSSVANVTNTIQYYTGSPDAAFQPDQNIESTKVLVPPRGALVFMYGNAATTVSSIILLALATLVRQLF